MRTFSCCKDNTSFASLSPNVLEFMIEFNINLLDLVLDIVLSDECGITHMLLQLVALTVERLDLGVVGVLLGFYFFEAFYDLLLLIEFITFHHFEAFNVINDLQVFPLLFQFFDVHLSCLVNRLNICFDSINLLIELLVGWSWQHITFERGFWDFSFKGNLKRLLFKFSPWSLFSPISSSTAASSSIISFVISTSTTFYEEIIYMK